jgi:alpha-D-xyloside xylohydrolase
LKIPCKRFDGGLDFSSIEPIRWVEALRFCAIIDNGESMATVTSEKELDDSHKGESMAANRVIGGTLTIENGVLLWRSGSETVRVEPWGANSARVRVTMGPLEDTPGALLVLQRVEAVAAYDGTGGGVLTVGELTVELKSNGHLRFTRSADGKELLAEKAIHSWWPGPRNFTAGDHLHYRIEQQFFAYDNERIFGLGQYQHGCLDQKGLVLDLVQRNAEVSIPFLVSSRGYGLLWNNPAVGRVELGRSATRWVADSASQIDYWITTGSPTEISAQYADATGHSPMLPDWAAGFWQSKLRYLTQDELLDVAREYHNRGLPLAVIVTDFLHSPHAGDWAFEPTEWPDPSAMVKELASMGTKLMVSVWPNVSINSRNHEEMMREGLFIKNERGLPFHSEFPDRDSKIPPPVSFIDATNPDARRYMWEQIQQNYYEHGVRIFWLDACEPEMRPEQTQNLRFHAGPGPSVINRYPFDHARAIYDGMRSCGESEIISLCRSAWAGSQRFGAAVWSGDTGVDFETLRAQFTAGLNIGLAGIPWWTSDIGGFHGGDPDDPAYRELIIRWFQYGVWCPLFRLHGHREPRTDFTANITGGPNEVWSYGDQAYGILSDLIRLRERMTPYILSQMQEATRSGTPPMRPIWFDAPDDEIAWTIQDEFMFGPDVLVAPVGELGARTRNVYLPEGRDWRHVELGETFAGGSWYEVNAPLEWIPVFVDAASHLEFNLLELRQVSK